MGVNEHFSSGLHRLKRAYTYIETLGSETQQWLKGDIYGLAFQSDAKDQPFLQVTHVEATPQHFGGLIGDALHNMRSALDHMAFGLVVATYGRRRIPKEIETSSEFPIFNSGPKFRERRRNGDPTPRSGLAKIRGIDPTAQAEIERLQPYHRRKSPENRVLWVLQQLSNADKHRTPPLTLLNVVDSRITVEFEGGRLGRQISVYGRLKPRTVIARWEVEHLAAKSQMKVYPKLKLAVAFGKGPAKSEVAAVALADIWNFINNGVRPRLKPFLA